MKKISILTFWGVANFGAWTQAYALNKVLNEICGKDTLVEHIAYLEKQHWDNYYCHDRRLENAFSYNWDLIPHTKVLNEKELEQTEFDVVCIGSDAVWEFAPQINEDLHLCGRNLKYNRLFSYAASFGDISLDHLPKEIKDIDFNVFQSLSVRDNNSRQILNLCTDKEVDVVLDPALLWDFKADEAVKKTAFKNYIVVYGVNWTDEFIYRARKYAHENGLQLISAGYINHWCDLSLRLVELRTLEWIGLFKGAHKVYTSTFHGLMLGLNFEKDIAFCQVEYVKNRSQTLLEELDIEEAVRDFGRIIDYDEVNGKLERLRNKSMDYLTNAVN